jgi:hypothetical protein
VTIENKISNGGFEICTFSPWIYSNATITSEFCHSGSFTARLFGGSVNSYLIHFAEVNPPERYEFLVSLAKAGTNPSPPLSLSVAYYNASFVFLGYGLIINIPANQLPNVAMETWLEINQTTSPIPLGTTQALVLINKLPLAGSADVLVDDVSFLTIDSVIELTRTTASDNLSSGSLQNNRMNVVNYFFQ